MSDTPDPTEPPGVDPALLSYLKRLVTVLTAVMIIGVLSIVALLVSRLHDFGPTNAVELQLPETIEIPEGSTATAFTKGGGWYAIVTDKDELLIFDDQTGELRQTIQIE